MLPMALYSREVLNHGKIWYYPVRPGRAIDADEGYDLRSEGKYKRGYDI